MLSFYGSKQLKAEDILMSVPLSVTLHLINGPRGDFCFRDIRCTFYQNSLNPTMPSTVPVVTARFCPSLIRRLIYCSNPEQFVGPLPITMFLYLCGPLR